MLLLNIIIQKLIYSIIIYFFGYMNWSITWILIPLLINIVNKQNKKQCYRKKYLWQKISTKGEKKVLLENIGDLPAWVHFPDIEKADWVNKIAKQLWPNVNHYARNYINKHIENSLRRNLEKYSLKGFKFERIVLGSVPFQIGGVIVYENMSQEDIVMDLDVSYAGDCDIKFRLQGLNGGIKNLQLYGKLRIVFKPLLASFPLFGGLQFFFLSTPDIDFNLDGVAGILEAPIIKNFLRKAILDTINSMLVLPNKYPLRLSKNVSAAQLKVPNPAGVLRVHVIEAKHLMKMDLTITGKGKSDPYAVLSVEEQQFKTETIFNTVNPRWDYWCEFIVLERTGQQMLIYLWDEDTTEDEPLGRVTLELSNLIKEGQSDLWLNLQEAKHGKIHLRTTWISLSTNYSDLQLAIEECKQLGLSYTNTALLIIFINSATDLEPILTFSKPDPYVKIKVGNQIKCTKSKEKTVNPVWEEGFIFFVKNPVSDFLNLSVCDFNSNREICNFNYKIKELSNNNNLELIHHSLRPHKGGEDCKIILSLHLKILKNNNKDKLTTEYLEARTSSFINNGSYSTSSPSSSSSSISDKSVENQSNFSEISDASSSSVIRSTFYGYTNTINKGQIQLTLRYSVLRQRLTIIVHTFCANGIKTEENDVYVKIYLLPNKNKDTKRKTRTIKKSCNPTFDQKFEYLVTQNELNNKKLEVSVVKENKLVKNRVMGKVIIKLENYYLLRPNTDWFDLG